VSATLVAQMFGADLLKLRKRRGTVIWALVLALGPLLVFFIVRAAQHSSNPLAHGPAGGIGGYGDALRLLANFFGPLAAIMVGTDSGAGDVAAGVFRDLVVTGRSRVALFASRVPAALCICWLVICAGFVLVVIGTYAFASGTPTPDGQLIIDGLLFTLLSTGTICAVAVGFAALTVSRPAALTVLIGWQLVASPLLAGISSLGSSRRIILSQAIEQFSPVTTNGHGPFKAQVTMPDGIALLVIGIWLICFLALGAWRTRTMDA
jgi:hypothetical protein